MDTKLKLCHQLDSILKYLTPLLPLANCHMVEFLTERHWERLIPAPLRRQLEENELNESLNKFWNIPSDYNLSTGVYNG